MPMAAMYFKRLARQSSGSAHMRVYADDQPVYDQDYPPEGFINPTLSLPAGPHRIVIVAWNNAGPAIVSPTRNITVQ